MGLGSAVCSDLPPLHTTVGTTVTGIRTTFIRQIPNHRIHHVIPCPADQGRALFLLGHEIHRFQKFHMMAEGRSGNGNHFLNTPDAHTLRPRTDKQTIDLQSCRVAQGIQSVRSFFKVAHGAKISSQALQSTIFLELSKYSFRRFALEAHDHPFHLENQDKNQPIGSAARDRQAYPPSRYPLPLRRRLHSESGFRSLRRVLAQH